MHCFLSGLPTVGIHALKLRDAAGVGEKDKLAVLTSQVWGRPLWEEGGAELHTGPDACPRPPPASHVHCSTRSP